MISGMRRAQSSTTSVSHVAHLDGSACITVSFFAKTIMCQKKKSCVECGMRHAAGIAACRRYSRSRLYGMQLALALA
jgi:hypothetical protein